MVLRGGVGAAVRIGGCVVVAGFAGDAGVQLFQIVALGGVVNVAASIMRIPGESIELVELAVNVDGADAHAEDGNVVAQKLLEDDVVLVGVEFRIVHAIGNKDDYLAALPTAIFQ